MIEDTGSKVDGAIKMLQDERYRIALHVNRLGSKTSFDKIDRLVIGNRTCTFSLPISNIRGGNLSPKMLSGVVGALGERLSSDAKGKTIINGAIKALISLNDHLFPDGPGSYSLPSIRCVDLNSGLVGFIEGCSDLFTKGDGRSTLVEFSDEMVVDLILSLDDRQQTAINGLDLERVTKLEHDLIPLLLQMQVVGIRIDKDNLNTFLDHLERAEYEIKTSLPDGFNEYSTNDVMRALGLHNPEGVNLPINITVDHLRKSKVGRAIHRLRVINGYRIGVNHLTANIGSDGRVHPNWTSLSYDRYGSYTGKIYCSNPNLQSIPRNTYEDGTPNIEARMYRDIFVPNMDNGAFLQFDYNAFELRIIANLSRNKELVDVFGSGGVVNPYQKLADQMGIDSPQLAKKFLLGVNHGLSARTIMNQLDIPMKKVSEYFNGIMEPLRHIRERYEKMAMRDGRITTPTGRIIPCDKPHLGFSRLLQAHGADILKVKLRSLFRRGYNIVMVNQDSITIEVDDPTFSDSCMEDIKYAIENLTDAPVKMVTRDYMSQSFNFEE